MAGKQIPAGTVHALPADLKEALTDDSLALEAWRDITPLARNEWICWVEDAKREETRTKRIGRAHEELAQGTRRPCCWPG
ncbi:MAG: YdeI/OmpD-associated family protein, partial [Ornithinimicrobium sp.]